jgi:hypothetical protein
MPDRRAHAARLDIAALRAAQRVAAHQILIAAQGCAEEAGAACREAEQRAESAASTWDAHLGSSGFAPEFASALAAELIAHSNASTAASDELGRAAEALRSAERDWCDADARCSVADRAVAESRRRLARDRDDRMLSTQADRTALRWRQA